MKNLLKKAYSNNYIFYSLGAFTSFFLFFFTLFLFLSFLTVIILELKTAFFPKNEEELEHVEAEGEEAEFEVEKRTEFSNSGENEKSNPKSNQPI